MLRATAVGVGLISAMALAGCENGTPPPTPSPSPGNGETINGRERLGWDQRAASAAELSTFLYAIYVDGARSQVADVTCAGTAGAAGFACSGALPPMTAGAHTLELTAFLRDQAGLESARSSPLRVTVVAAAPGDAGSAWTDGEAGITADGLALFVQHLADGLDGPVDATFDRDGRLFIAERAGRIVLFDEGRLVPTASLAPRDTGAGDLLALALDPDFANTRHVYTLATVELPGRPAVFRLSRYRELRGVLAQRAILLETPAPPDPAGTLRFGPDARLYLALGTATDNSPSSYLGKVLRLNADGTAPRDRPGALPIFADGHIAPRAMAWGHAGGTLWIADGTAEGIEWITGIGVAGDPPPRAAWGMPPAETTSSLAFYDSDRIPELRGQLFVASAAARRLLRIRLDAADPLKVVSTEPLLEDRVGPIHVVLPGPDGTIYFCTETTLGRLMVGDRR